MYSSKSGITRFSRSFNASPPISVARAPISLARSFPDLSHALLRARSSPWALAANFFLSASTSTALLETLAALLLPATYELSCVVYSTTGPPTTTTTTTTEGCGKPLDPCTNDPPPSYGSTCCNQGYGECIHLSLIHI